MISGNGMFDRKDLILHKKHQRQWGVLAARAAFASVISPKDPSLLKMLQRQKSQCLTTAVRQWFYIIHTDSSPLSLGGGWRHLGHLEDRKCLK